MLYLELNYYTIFVLPSLAEALIAAIENDIEEAKRALDLPEHQKWKDDNFFHLPSSNMVNSH